MKDEQIAKIYTDGNAVSHTAGLRAVYEAGCRHDERGYPGSRELTQGEVDALHAAKKGAPTADRVSADDRLTALERGTVLIADEPTQEDVRAPTTEEERIAEVARSRRPLKVNP